MNLRPTLAAAVLLLAPALLVAQDEPVERTPPGRWVLGSSFGAGTAGGGYGEFLEKPVNFDLNVGYEPRSRDWRFGIGIEFGSMAMKPPHEDEMEWARFDTHLYATRIFNTSAPCAPTCRPGSASPGSIPGAGSSGSMSRKTSSRGPAPRNGPTASASPSSQPTSNTSPW